MLAGLLKSDEQTRLEDEGKMDEAANAGAPISMCRTDPKISLPNSKELFASASQAYS
jgi:hypothetical protein